jgi:hypothetical protein
VNLSQNGPHHTNDKHGDSAHRVDSPRLPALYLAHYHLLLHCVQRLIQQRGLRRADLRVQRSPCVQLAERPQVDLVVQPQHQRRGAVADRPQIVDAPLQPLRRPRIVLRGRGLPHLCVTQVLQPRQLHHVYHEYHRVKHATGNGGAGSAAHTQSHSSLPPIGLHDTRQRRRRAV